MVCDIWAVVLRRVLGSLKDWFVGVLVAGLVSNVAFHGGRLISHHHLLAAGRIGWLAFRYRVEQQAAATV